MKKHTILLCALVLFSQWGCLRQKAACTTQKDCFGNEQCVAGQCQLTKITRDMAQDDSGEKDLTDETPDTTNPDTIMPLARQRYIHTEKLDVAQVNGQSVCTLKLDKQQRPHLMYGLANNGLRYRKWNGQQWREVTLKEEFAFYQNAHFALNHNDQAIFCTIDYVEETLLIGQIDADKFNIIRKVENVGSEGQCQVHTDGDDIWVAYTKVQSDEGTRRLYLQVRQNGQWRNDAIDPGEHKSAYNPQWIVGDGLFGLWYFAIQGGQSYWRRGTLTQNLWQFETQKAVAGVPQPDFHIVVDREGVEHGLFIESESIAGEQFNVASYWNFDKDVWDVDVEGGAPITESTALTIDANNRPQMILNDGSALYWWIADETSWSIQRLEYSDWSTYSDCVEIQVDDMGKSHLIYYKDDELEHSIVYTILK